MKVILLRDVAKIGRRFEVKEVPSGHAINFLIPRKMAEAATPEALKRLKVEFTKRNIVTERHDESFTSIVQALKDRPVTVAVPANEQGHLFKGIHAADIASVLAKEGFGVQSHEVILEHPLKEVGEHRVALRSGSIVGECTLVITKA